MHTYATFPIVPPDPHAAPSGADEAERISALDAFRDALDRLDEVMEAIGDKYAASLERGEYERAEVPRPELQHTESA